MRVPRGAGRNGGGPRSALGGPKHCPICSGGMAAMEEGRDRPSEVHIASRCTLPSAPQWRRAEIGPRRPFYAVMCPRSPPGGRAAMEEGRDRPSEGIASRPFRRTWTSEPQWRRAEIGPRRPPRRAKRWAAAAAMEEGRDRPSEGRYPSKQPRRTPAPQWRRAEIGPRRYRGSYWPQAGRNGGGPRSALGGLYLGRIDRDRGEIGPRRRFAWRLCPWRRAGRSP